MSLQSHRPATAFQAGLLKARNLSLLNSRSIRKQRSDWPDHASAYDVEHSLCLQCTQNNFLQVSQTHESISIPLKSPVPTSSNLKVRLDISTDDQYCNNYANTPGQGRCYVPYWKATPVWETANTEQGTNQGLTRKQ